MANYSGFEKTVNGVLAADITGPNGMNAVVATGRLAISVIQGVPAWAGGAHCIRRLSNRRSASSRTSGSARV